MEDNKQKEFYIKLGKRVKTQREEIGMSQDHLSKILGIHRPALAQLESGKRKVSAHELKELSEIFMLSVDYLLGNEKKAIVNVQDKKANTEKFSFRVNATKFEKFRAVFLYILNKVGSRPNVGETVLNKILYFIDFNYYEQNQRKIIGLNYKRNHYGPTPVELKPLINKLIDNDQVEVVKSKSSNPEYAKSGKYTKTKYLPLVEPDVSVLSASELEIINEVLYRYSKMSANQISELSHRDPTWKLTKEGKIIDYDLVFERNERF